MTASPSSASVLAVSRAREGDTSALIDLIELCADSISSAVASIRPAAGMELAEAMHLARIRILDKFAIGYEGTGTPCAWMATVARNRTRDYVRQETRHTQRTVPLDSAPGALERSVEGRQSEWETWDAVHRVLAELPEADAEILRMHYLADRSLKEMAHELGYSYDGIRSKLRRACGKAQVILMSHEMSHEDGLR